MIFKAFTSTLKLEAAYFSETLIGILPPNIRDVYNPEEYEFKKWPRSLIIII
jgi:hypothetical protein